MNKILIIKPSGIGDIVHSLPVLYGLKVLFPESKIHWLVFGKFEKILSNIPEIDKIIPWDRSGGVREYTRIITAVRKERYDLVVDLQGLLRTAIISFLSGGARRVAVSLLRELSWLFEKPVGKFDPDMHAVDRGYAVVRHLAGGKALPEPASFIPWIRLTSEEKASAKKLLNEPGVKIDRPLVLFGVTSRGAHKVWPSSNFIELINETVKKYDVIPVFLAMKEEAGMVKRVTGGLDCGFIDLTGKTDLRQACAVLSFCSLVVGNDSSLIHIACALDVPVVGLYGPTNPLQVGPYGEKSAVVFKKLKCNPCGIKTSCTDYKCMKEITPEDVNNYISAKLHR
ncbi:MAG: lipopolysaccharide heptosyltransferase II [Elusimicrobiota bacterium]